MTGTLKKALKNVPTQCFVLGNIFVEIKQRGLANFAIFVCLVPELIRFVGGLGRRRRCRCLSRGRRHAEAGWGDMLRCRSRRRLASLATGACCCGATHDDARLGCRSGSCCRGAPRDGARSGRTRCLASLGSSACRRGALHDATRGGGIDVVLPAWECVLWWKSFDKNFFRSMVLKWTINMGVTCWVVNMGAACRVKQKEGRSS